MTRALRITATMNDRPAAPADDPHRAPPLVVIDLGDA